MKSVENFNGLNGRKATRTELERQIDHAVSQEQYHIAEKLQMVLDSYPDDSEFFIEITTPAKAIEKKSADRELYGRLSQKMDKILAKLEVISAEKPAQRKAEEIEVSSAENVSENNKKAMSNEPPAAKLNGKGKTAEKKTSGSSKGMKGTSCNTEQKKQIANAVETSDKADFPDPGQIKNYTPGSLAHELSKRAEAYEYYEIKDKEISDFLGRIEKKKRESLAITLAGGQGSMKTRMLFRLMNAFAQTYKCGHASIEEHPASAIYKSKVDQYISQKARENIFAPEINSIDDLTRLVESCDVIFIDSFPKLQEMCKGFELDKDLRKKYDGKLFIVIYQLTVDGKMRGGSKSQFDGDIILLTESFPDYKQNYVYANKNRYQDMPLHELKYNIFQGKIERKMQDIAQTDQADGKSGNVKFSFDVLEY